MTLKEIIEKAVEDSPRFKQKYLWVVQQKKKVPEWDWLMDELTIALGRDFMEQNAREEIAKNETTTEEAPL